MNPKKFIFDRFKYDLNDLKAGVGKFEYGGIQLDFHSLSQKSESDLRTDENAMKLYKYFLINMVCSENILINTVGLPYSHKYPMETSYYDKDGVRRKREATFDEMDSNAHITMVKRMVALTATSHNMMKGVLSGHTSVIKTMVWENDTAEMVAFSGRSTDGMTPISHLDINDGLMISTRISDNLAKQSIGDVKPLGNALKYLVHDFRPDKGAARLIKMASNSIDNAYLRSFSYGMPGVRDPRWFIEMQLSDAKIESDSIKENGYIVGYDGINVFPLISYYTKDGVINKVTDVKAVPDGTDYKISFKVNSISGNCTSVNG